MSVQSQVSINSKPCCPSAILNVIPSFYRIDLARILTHGPIDLSPPSPRIRFQGTWIWVRQERSGINRILITLAAPCYKQDLVADSKNHLWTHWAHISNLFLIHVCFFFNLGNFNHDKCVTWLAASNIMWMTCTTPQKWSRSYAASPRKKRWNMVVAVLKDLNRFSEWIGLTWIDLYHFLGGIGFHQFILSQLSYCKPLGAIFSEKVSQFHLFEVTLQKTPQYVGGKL